MKWAAGLQLTQLAHKAGSLAWFLQADSHSSIGCQHVSRVMWTTQVVSKHDYSKAADVYSFGIILWEMMTWRLPWDELNPFQVKCNTRVGQTSIYINKLSTEA